MDHAHKSQSQENLDQNTSSPTPTVKNAIAWFSFGISSIGISGCFSNDQLLVDANIPPIQESHTTVAEIEENKPSLVTEGITLNQTGKLILESSIETGFVSKLTEFLEQINSQNPLAINQDIIVLINNLVKPENVERFASYVDQIHDETLRFSNSNGSNKELIKLDWKLTELAKIIHGASSAQQLPDNVLETIESIFEIRAGISVLDKKNSAVDNQIETINFFEGIRVPLASGEELEISRSSQDVNIRLIAIILDNLETFSENKIVLKPNKHNGVFDTTINFYEGSTHSFKLNFNDSAQASIELSTQLLYCIYGDSYGKTTMVNGEFTYRSSKIGIGAGSVQHFDEKHRSGNLESYKKYLNELRIRSEYQLEREQETKGNKLFNKETNYFLGNGIRKAITGCFLVNELELLLIEHGKKPHVHLYKPIPASLILHNPDLLDEFK